MTTNSIAVPQATAPQHTPIASSDRQAARPTMPHDSQAAMTNSAADPNTPWRMPTQAELRENPWVVPLLKVMVPGWIDVDPTLTMDVALVVAALERRAAASAQSPQALLLRGSADFAAQEQYHAFLAGFVAKRNSAGAAALEEERKHLRALPSSPVPGYTIVPSKVRKWSTIRVGGKTYSVPSRLLGHDIQARLYPNVVEVYYRDERVLTMPRLHGEREHRIDYRHVIWSLVKKPGAFARYRYREELFPSLVFRRAYDSLVSRRGDRADVEYVRILHLAASTMESSVEKLLAELLATDAAFDYAQVKARCAPTPTPFPQVAIGTPDLSIYDGLLALGAA